jgi:hypothetical protein
MLAATPSIGFPEFKTMGKTVTDLAVGEASEHFGPAGPSAHAGKTAQHAATASAAWKNGWSLIAALRKKGLQKGGKLPRLRQRLAPRPDITRQIRKKLEKDRAWWSSDFLYLAWVDARIVVFTRCGCKDSLSAFTA